MVRFRRDLEQWIVHELLGIRKEIKRYQARVERQKTALAVKYEETLALKVRSVNEVTKMVEKINVSDLWETAQRLENIQRNWALHCEAIDNNFRDFDRRIDKQEIQCSQLVGLVKRLDDRLSEVLNERTS